MQSRIHSLVESLVNVAIGYLIAVAAQIAVFPLFGYSIKLGDNFLIGLVFAAISIARSYIIRRWFTSGVRLGSAKSAAAKNLGRRKTNHSTGNANKWKKCLTFPCG